MGIFTVKNEPVSKGDSWILVIPFTPIWIWAFWRIKSLTRGAPIIIGTFFLGVGLQQVLPFPYGMGVTWLIISVIAIFFHRRWAKAYNKQFENS